MLFGFAILATAILLSMVAAYYSIAGLTAIFAAATIPVIIMGGSLELGKIVATVWLHNNWRRAPFLFKAYLVPAVAFLMLLTSMGIFGYLSKAHSDQSLVSGDVIAKIAIYDEKIKIERENIDANRKALKQLDEAVDQVMARSTDEKGADKAVAIRRSQQKDRARLLEDIARSQTKITSLNEERAPIAAEVRKVEAEVGPIKYIAALVYGDNPDTNVLERAVRWVIIMIVLVFDPLALTLILAANKQFEWARRGTGGWLHDEDFEKELQKKRAVAQALDNQEPLPVPPEDITTVTEDTTEGSLLADPKYSYLTRGDFWKKPEGWASVGPIVAKAPEPDENIEDEPAISVREAMREWKAENPYSSLKEQRRKLAHGDINELPWMAKIKTKITFGSELPVSANKGDLHVSTVSIPHRVFKWNGNSWISVDKDRSDNYTYDVAYIDYLISQIQSGEYDLDLLSNSEREQVEARLSSNG
jgi:hypothetical protein